MARKVAFVPQATTADCGAACLAMVLGYFGRHETLGKLRAACQVSRDGSNAADLMRTARAYGLEVKAHRLEPEELVGGPFPCILHWRFNHFLVATGSAPRGGLWVIDPSEGPRLVAASEVNEAFTGVRLSFARGPEFDFSKGHFAAALLVRLFRATTGAVLLESAGAIAVEFLGLLFPVASQITIDFIVVPRQKHFLLVLGGVLACACAVRAAVQLARARIGAELRMKLDAELIERDVRTLAFLRLAFFAERSSGDLLQRAQNNAAVCEMLRALTGALSEVILLLGYVTVMFAYNSSLGAATSCVMLLRCLLVAATQRWVQTAVRNEVSANALETQAVVEAFSSAEALKTFGNEKAAYTRFVNAMTRRFNATMSRAITERNVFQTLPLLDAVALALVFWLAGEQVAQGKMTFGVLAAFLSMMYLASRAVQGLVGAASRWAELRETIVRLHDSSDVDLQPRTLAPTLRLEGSIRLRGVSVRYGRSVPALDGINLEIAPGERVLVTVQGWG